MARLMFYRGDDLLIDYRLRPGRTAIGRSDASDVALPGEEISRTHCLIDGEGDRWEIVDRSRHGTRVNGRSVRRADLADGDRIEIGVFRVELRLFDRAAAAAPTAEAPPDRLQEQLVLGEDGHPRVERAALVVVSGPDAGRRYELKTARASVGRLPSMLALSDPTLVPDHCRLRVSRGRVMVEPGAGPVILDGVRIRDITPVYAGEEITLGDTVLRVELGVVDEPSELARFGEMVGESAQMRRLFGSLRRVAAHHFPVLLLGESGTGKELAARGIHDNSPRAAGPFVAVNCGAVPEALFESELFGHERGAFTGAVKRSDGAFHRAAGGTLFLDEVGELPEPAQAKMLRVLESGEVRRVGGEDVEYPDVRIVAATNRDLAGDAGRGSFREDLFYRLAVLSVALPPLRERLDDLEALCRAVCARLNPEAAVTPEGLRFLESHDWPGNVRELRNVLTRAYVLGGPRIGAEHLTFHEMHRVTGAPSGAGRAISVPTLEHTVEQAERAYLHSVMRRHNDNRSAVSRELGIPRTTLHYKLKRFGLI